MQANQQFVAEMSPLSPLLQNVLLQTSKGESSDFNAFSGNQGKVPVVLQHISNDGKQTYLQGEQYMNFGSLYYRKRKLSKARFDCDSKEELRF